MAVSGTSLFSSVIIQNTYLTSQLELHLSYRLPKPTATDGCTEKLLFANYLITANGCFLCELAYVSASHSLFE